jgi:hypothetical protein
MAKEETKEIEREIRTMTISQDRTNVDARSDLSDDGFPI